MLKFFLSKSNFESPEPTKKDLAREHLLWYRYRYIFFMVRYKVIIYIQNITNVQYDKKIPNQKLCLPAVGHLSSGLAFRNQLIVSLHQRQQPPHCSQNYKTRYFQPKNAWHRNKKGNTFCKLLYFMFLKTGIILENVLHLFD